MGILDFFTLCNPPPSLKMVFLLINSLCILNTTIQNKSEPQNTVLYQIKLVPLLFGEPVGQQAKVLGLQEDPCNSFLGRAPKVHFAFVLHSEIQVCFCVDDDGDASLCQRQQQQLLRAPTTAKLLIGFSIPSCFLVCRKTKLK